MIAILILEGDESQMPKVSIIIPVFNAEKYLISALESVINQSFTDFELIAINDGSSDSSLEILEKYSAKDNRIKLINKKNTGVSETRNYGIEQAHGEYIVFVDADDILNRDYLLNMVDIAQRDSVDLVICGYSLIDKRGNQREINIPYQRNNAFVNGEMSIFSELQVSGLAVQLWNKLIRTEVVVRNRIRFEKSASFDEDMFFCWKVSMCVKNAEYCQKALYQYRLTGSSAIMRYHSDLLQSYRIQIKDLIHFAIERNFYSTELDKEVDRMMGKKVGILCTMVIRSNKRWKEKLQDIEMIIQDERIRKGIIDNLEESNKINKIYLQGDVRIIALKTIILEIRRKLARLIR